MKPIAIIPMKYDRSSNAKNEPLEIGTNQMEIRFKTIFMSTNWAEMVHSMSSIQKVSHLKCMRNMVDSSKWYKH